MADIRDSLAKALFSDPETHAFVILDGAQNLDLLVDLDRLGARAECLFPGEQEPEVLIAAPHLVPIGEGSEVFDWVVQGGAGRNWGIYVVARMGFIQVCGHFHALSAAQLPDGRLAWFRYYDPRVLRVFLPSCDAVQKAEMFGDVVVRYVVENAPGAEPPILTFDA